MSERRESSVEGFGRKVRSENIIWLWCWKIADKTFRISNWKDLVVCYERISSRGGEWIFRGQKSSEWGLQTTLERSILHFGTGTSQIPRGNSLKITKALKDGLEGKSVFQIEGGLLRRFMRQYHHYSNTAPDEGNTMEWLALMRHYGVPSRLLDWTFSFFVAVYFAVEEVEADKACSVYALNMDWLGEKGKRKYPRQWKLLDSDPNVKQNETFKKVFGPKRPKKVVYATNPFGLDERSVIQQGIFLCPGNVCVPFDENLRFLQDRNPEKQFVHILQIKADLKQRKEILQMLHRMNMNRATLFPGLDGFGQSLKIALVNPTILRPPLDWEG